MVFFTCNACNESMKKSQVEKHINFKCRRCEYLSCVDCSQEFWGNDYVQHTKCITEDAKYGGKDYKPKPNANKGERKQEAWTEQVQRAIEKSATNFKLKKELEKLKAYSNIPRKKAKFENFVKNSLRIHPNMASQLWEAISVELTSSALTTETSTMEKEKSVTENGSEECKQPDSVNPNKENPEGCEENQIKKLSKREKKLERQKEQHKESKKEKKNKSKNKEGREMNANNTEEETSGKKEKKRKRVIENGEKQEEERVGEKKSKKKKRKLEDTHVNGATNGHSEEAGAPKAKKNTSVNSLNDTIEHPKKGKFSWEDTIVSFLKKADDQKMGIKKLRKKVMSAYAAHHDQSTHTEEKLLAKFNKKVTKNAMFKVHKDKVTLLS